VIVPTRDRPSVLARCLEALAHQTIAEEIEIVVVDDGSADSPAIANVVARHARARLLRTGGQGPAAARNAGARAAAGSFLCFTDDDCGPHEDWVERMVDALRHGADAVSGTVLATGGVLSEASELVARAAATVRLSGADDATFAPSGNLACRSAVFAATPFDESYPEAAGEDREWSARLLAGGYRLRAEPRARVVHYQELTLPRFLRQQIRYGEGAYRFRRLGATRVALEPPTFYIALMRSAFAQDFRVGVLVCIAQAATALGFARAWTADRRSPRLKSAS
jgi:glycosyltransferase involved in cell wall biosynthesis